ncbi:hypothetical protein [Xenorhabdus cabanillasii]|nr:hypothetical protein [Xenorhabdus cabanillasii]
MEQILCCSATYQCFISLKEAPSGDCINQCSVSLRGTPSGDYIICQT